MKLFSDSELEILNGKFSKIAKSHNVDRSYPGFIANGKRKITTDKAKLILADLFLELVKVKQSLIATQDV